MKRSATILSILALAVVCMISCEKNTFNVRNVTYPDGQAMVKLGLFTAYNTSSPMRIAINGATVTSEITYGTPFPGGGFNTGGSNNSDYLLVTPGSNKVELFNMNQGTTKPISRLAEATITVEANKRYTLFLADTAQNIAAWVVNDDTPTPDSGFARIKFVHAMPNVAAVDLYKGAKDSVSTLIISNVPYKGVSAYINVQAGTDSFFIRKAGDQPLATPIARRGFTLSNQRIYTLFSRGYLGTTGTRIPNLSAVINQ